TVLFFELVFVFFTQIQNALHVNFVESRQNGVVGLRLQQALGYACTQATHGHALLGTTIERKRSRCYRSSCLLCRCTACLKRIALGDATVSARTFYRCGVYTFFSQNLAGGRRSN